MPNWTSIRYAAAMALLLGACSQMLSAQTAPPTPQAPALRAYRHPVTIWVPPYAVRKSIGQLTAAFGDTGVKDGITHLALQLWSPTLTGGLHRSSNAEVTDSSVAELRDWAHSHGIRVLLCVYNGAMKWDWPLARAAFGDHRKEFVKSLVDETVRSGLDGVDIDLEGPGSFEADKPAFMAFMTDLSTQLHARKMHLTVDSFSGVWNAPNQGWWADLFPLVDALTTMGYEEIGLTPTDWRGYAAQKKAAGAFAARLQIGMPSDKELWKGSTALQQLQWVCTDASMGIAIWDAQLPSAAWTAPEVWKAIRQIRGDAADSPHS